MKQVLIVEDNPENLKLAQEALDNKYHTAFVTTGSEAVRYLSNSLPDLIILEAKMSDMSGFDIISYMKQELPTKEIPVIFLIKQNDLECEGMAHKSGECDIVFWPFSKETLANRVNLYLELYEYRTNTAVIENLYDAISVSLAELVECRDETTGGHIKNTTQYFKILLEEVIKQEEYNKIIPTQDIKDLLRSVPLHDIGKIGINDDILRKTTSLDYDEFESMKTHTLLGRETFDKIIKETGDSRLLQIAKDLAYCHHERWDGTGYPNGISGEEIPLYARILSIADVYDAITSKRAYKEAFSHQMAMEIITEGKGKLFDPKLVDIFVKAGKRFEQALFKKDQDQM